MRLLPIVGLLAACSGTKDSAPAEPAPTFTEVRDEVLMLSCALASCHGGATSGLELDKDAPEEAWAALVNATADSGRVLVVPGDPDGSYLIQKLRADEGIEGDPMPPPFGLLHANEEAYAKIEAWVAAGARDD